MTLPLDPASAILQKASEHEKIVEASLIGADLIMSELNEHPEVKGTKAEKDILRKHKKYIASAKWHAKQIQKLERSYQRAMEKFGDPLADNPFDL